MIVSLFVVIDLVICVQSVQVFLSLLMFKVEIKVVINVVMIVWGECFVILCGVVVVLVKGLFMLNFFVLECWFGWVIYQGFEEMLNLLVSNEEVFVIVLEFDISGGMVFGCEVVGVVVVVCVKVKLVYVLVNFFCVLVGYWFVCVFIEIVVMVGLLIGFIGMMCGVYVVEELFYEFCFLYVQVKNFDFFIEEGKVEIQKVLDLVEVKFYQVIVMGCKILLVELFIKISVIDDVKDGG